jgi:hypothetical protein
MDVLTGTDERQVFNFSSRVAAVRCFACGGLLAVLTASRSSYQQALLLSGAESRYHRAVLCVCVCVCGLFL